MNDKARPDYAWPVTVILLPLLIFVLPSMLALFGDSGIPNHHRFAIIVMSVLYAAVFCVNYFWLVPATMIRGNRKSLLFLYNLVIILTSCVLITMWAESHGGIPFLPDAQHASVMKMIVGYICFALRDFITMVFSAALACALRLARQQEILRRRELELEAERHNIELKSLKAQLNPHFLFNAINNIYSLIAVSSDRAQKALYEFSGILRFLIYDASAVFVPLTKELGFIKDYVELMKLRLNPSVRLDCEIAGDDGGELTIAPLLLLTIVENAFKHMSRNAAGMMSISIRIGIEGEWFVCSVINSCSAGNDDGNAEHASGSGVGLDNVGRQLRLLYPGRHLFMCGREGDAYRAEIRILRSAMCKGAGDDQTLTR